MTGGLCLGCSRPLVGRGTEHPVCPGCGEPETVCDCDEFDQVVTGGPWAERHGRPCREVTEPPGYDRYPWHGLQPTEVVVLIDGDPHLSGKEHWPTVDGVLYEWSCVLWRRDVKQKDG